ncbi:hypothetical protein ACFU7X_02490 [Streptomyces chartreusis]|uniref:hypothetical protein n=1 Tax=Streptomyces chartreusis TaxID=1969 RepID=UPI0036CD676A
MRFYAWYIAVSAGYINYHTKGCATVQGGWARARWSSWHWFVVPYVWKRRC